MLRTDLFRILRDRGWSIVIFSPFGGDPEFQKEFGGKNVIFEALRGAGALSTRFAYLRGMCMQGKHPVLKEARHIHHHMTRRFRPPRTLRRSVKNLILRLAAALIPPPLRRSQRFWERLIRSAMPKEVARIYFEKYRPDLVVVGSAGAEGNDVPFIIEANAHRVPSIVVDSNLDAATYRYFSAPWLVSHWALAGEPQRQEFHKLHGIPLDSMSATGALRYDHYFKGFGPLLREEFCRSIGVDPAKKLIIMGAKTPIVFPHNDEIIGIILDEIKSGRYGDAQLYVRFDPGHDISIYSKEFLGSFSWERAEDAPGEDHIGNLLYHADVYLGLGATTLSIEACAVGTPSLWIGFDGNTVYKDRRESCRLQYDLPVFKRLVASGGIPLVESREDLLRQIEIFLKNPDINKKERETMLQTEYANAEDGRAGERIVALIDGLI